MWWAVCFGVSSWLRFCCWGAFGFVEGGFGTVDGFYSGVCVFLFLISFCGFLFFLCLGSTLMNMLIRGAGVGGGWAFARFQVYSWGFGWRVPALSLELP